MFDQKTGSIGSRVQFGPTVQSLGNVLCDVVVNSKIPNAQLACQVLKAVTAGLAQPGSDVAAGIQLPGLTLPKPGTPTGLRGLLGGAQ